MVQTEMTVAVTRARSWCALGVAVTAAAKAGCDGANGGWKAQGTVAAEAVGGGRGRETRAAVTAEAGRGNETCES